MNPTTSETTGKPWSNAQAFAAAVLCLLLGMGGGYLIRRSQAMPQISASANVSTIPAAMPPSTAPPSLAAATGIAEVQIGVKLEQLKVDPNNVDLLTEIGNIYYDSKQYPSAIEYYNRVLKIQPANTSVRTDLATAYWYMNDADTAIAEFNKSLSYEPTKANTLFNLGIVKWQGKKDGPGAIAAWKKLLDSNPGYPNKDVVLQLIAQAQAP